MQTEKEIVEEIRKAMTAIAKPYLIDCQADPFRKETARTLLNRIENEKSDAGNQIIAMMELALQKGKELGKQEGRKQLAEEIIEYIKRERYSNEETPFKNGFNIALDNLQNEKLQKEVKE